MSKPIVVLTRRWPAPVEAALHALFDLRCNAADLPYSADELRAALRSADAVCPTVTDRLGADVLDLDGMRTRVLANFGVGYNHIDLDTARRRGLTVTNTPGVLTDCTADLAMTLLLMVARRAGEGERMIREERWTGWCPTQMLGTRVSGKTLGLVGFGRIARALARRAHFGFGMRVIFSTPHPPGDEVCAAHGATPVATLDELLASADFISLHCPGGSATRHLIDAGRLALMKPTAYLVNTARGDVVDQRALVDALEGGRIAGAALDVYDGEPAVPAALKRLDNVVLLPHLGSASVETRIAMGMRVVENLQAFFAGQPPPDRVT